MLGIHFSVSPSLLLDSKTKRLENKGDSSYLMDFIGLDFIVYCIYCVELCLFSESAAALIETHFTPEPFTQIPITWCPASAVLPPGERDS